MANKKATEPSGIPTISIIVSDPIFVSHWYAVYPAERQLSVVARAFLDYLLGREDAAPASASKKS